MKDDSTAPNSIYFFTHDDVENILLQIDALYWIFLNLSQKREIKQDYDSQEYYHPIKAPLTKKDL
jgi:hypothetical protein